MAPRPPLVVVADGAYAPLVGVALPRTHVISRIRRDAALYDPAPPRTGRRGRPRTQGMRLPSLLTMTVCTDPEMAPSRVAELYDDRWCIAVTNRDVKQHLGAEVPQSWKGEGPERVVSLGC